MRTTLDLDDDVLKQAKCLAKQRNQSPGRVISDVFREKAGVSGEEPVRNGLRVIQRPGNAVRVTLDVVNRFRDNPHF